MPPTGGAGKGPATGAGASGNTNKPTQQKKLPGTGKKKAAQPAVHSPTESEDEAMAEQQATEERAAAARAKALKMLNTPASGSAVTRLTPCNQPIGNAAPLAGNAEQQMSARGEPASAGIPISSIQSESDSAESDDNSLEISSSCDSDSDNVQRRPAGRQPAPPSRGGKKRSRSSSHGGSVNAQKRRKSNPDMLFDMAKTYVSSRLELAIMPTFFNPHCISAVLTT